MPVLADKQGNIVLEVHVDESQMCNFCSLEKGSDCMCVCVRVFVLQDLSYICTGENAFLL